MKRKATRILLLTVLVLTCIAFAPMGTNAADRDVEWGCYQNSAENNGVVENVTLPTNYNETSLKWANSLVTGYTTSFTPPLIIDGDLVVASRERVYRIDKKTGEIKKQSEELYLNVGYAMNPITYDEEKDQIYIPILNGRVQCLDFETLRSKWVSKEYRYTQTLSPIVCKEGMVYTGIWEEEKEDGVFFCLNADTGEEVWSYTPSVDGVNSGDIKHGFYWAGAYVNDNYVVVGSDDGASNGFEEAGADGAYPETASAYSFNRRTGEVIDMITGVKGDIRSSVVYHGGFIYFATKGGRLYKARLGNNGKFSQISHIQLKDRYGADSMMTASPVIHNGRIYLGAAGSKGQFSADGGHFFAVISDDEVLSDSSLIYTVPVSGYPQAAPMLSTNTEAADGKVRLYFTFNAFPGGIYCLEDSPESTGESHEKAHLIYRPENNMQQYCISPLCCDRDGNMYYKNDSGNLMAIETNKAWLSDLSVTHNGDEIIWEKAFDSGQLNHVLHAPGGATSVKVIPRIPEGTDGEGMTVTVNGEPCGSSGITVSIEEEGTDVPVVVTRTIADRNWTRTYKLNIDSASNNADLAGLVINETNTKPKIVDTDDYHACTSGVGYDPQFDPGITEYVAKTYKKNKTFLNIWLQTADDRSTFKVLPVNNVGNSWPNKYMNEDGTLKSPGNGRYPVYWVKGANSAEVEVKVTSPSGNATKSYHITLVRSDDYLGVGEAPLVLSPYSTVLYTKGANRSVSITASYDGTYVTSQCTFESSEPEVATVDATGHISAVGRGEANIWVEYTNGSVNRRNRVSVEVRDQKLDPPAASMASGTYTTPLKVELMSNVSDGEIRYDITYDGEDPVTPTTTTGTLYKDPIDLSGVMGQTQTVKIRAIACGKGYEKSNRSDFTYTIDLTQGVQVKPNTVSTEPGSLYIPEDKVSLVSALPNGTTYAQLTEKLAQISTTRVVLTPGSEGEGIDVTDPERPFLDAPITWDGEDSYNYYPRDEQKQTFAVRGIVTLPDGIDSGGHDMHVYLPVTVLASKAPDPEPTPVPAPGKVKSITPTVKASAKKIATKWPAQAKAIKYKVAWRKAGGAWKYKTVTGRAYTITGLAARGCYEVRVAAVNDGGQGAFSPSKYCYIAKTVPTLKAKKKSFTVRMKKVKGATGYQVRYSLKSNLTSSKKKSIKKLSLTIKKLKGKKIYYVQTTPYKKVGGKTYMGQPVKKKVKTKK